MSFARRTRLGHLMVWAATIVALVACGDTAPPPPGTVVVNFSTAPGDENLFVWGVSVDGASPHNVNSSDTGAFAIEGVPAGDHHLIVSSLPAACTSGADNRDVTVPSKDTLRVTFAVKCTRTTGDIGLVVATSGSDLDPDGYTVIVDGSIGPSVPSTAATALTLPKIKPGSHEITLSGLASNCSVVASSSQHTAVVVAGQATTIIINVSCAFIGGTVRVVTNTTGSGTVDPNGYLLQVGTGNAVAMAPIGSVDVPMRAGTYDVTLSDVEPNCTTATPTQSVSVALNQTVVVNFDVSCGAYPATAAGITSSDPANDTLPNPANEPIASFDILAVNTRYAANFLTITLKLARAIGTSPIRGFIDLDLDENPATGVRPVMNDPVVGGAAPQGSEMFVYFEAQNGAGLFSSSTGAGSAINMVASGDSLQFFLPFERLQDDGNLTITTVLGTSRPTDYAPNSGVIVSHVPAGVAMLNSAMVDHWPSTLSPSPVAFSTRPVVKDRKTPRYPAGGGRK